jgi:SAM-dependent methyltransferase
MSRLHSPAAERNREAIVEQLERSLPPTGRILEIASGSGQHVAFFAKRLPTHFWQPSDIDPSALESIRGYVASAELDNVAEPIELDVLEHPWPVPDANAVLCSNMIHIAPWEAAIALFQGAASLLQTNGTLYLYGPFKRGDAPTSPSNADFDQSLKARNPDWGVRDLDAVSAVATDYGFSEPDIVEMPANNLFVTFTRLPGQASPVESGIDQDLPCVLSRAFAGGAGPSRRPRDGSPFTRRTRTTSTCRPARPPGRRGDRDPRARLHAAVQSTTAASNTGPSTQTRFMAGPASVFTRTAHPAQPPTAQAMYSSSDTCELTPCRAARSATARSIGVGPQA